MRNFLSSRCFYATVVLYAFFCMSFLVACNDGGSFNDYSATIRQGRMAAEEMMEKTGASSLSLAFVADNRVAWTETFGFADREAKTLPTTDTMYGIGSVSKMLAAIAAMVLVDRGEISLDDPVVTHIPSFEMLSPDYRLVTVRMLLNHSSGFPGGDMRNSFTASPFQDYSLQLLESLSRQRLKHPPGFMNAYCNDGFSLIENLIANVSGKNYVQFVQDEILTPLKMEHSRYALESFPAGSFAATYSGEDRNPQTFINLYASGGLYSTPSDMAKLILTILGKGKSGGVRILSGSAVETMAVDQTAETFNPVPSDNERFGLGWDTVSSPGLKAVGIKAWAKGGDTFNYGSVLMILPEEKMGVMISGASNFGSGDAIVVAERILLKALVEKGIIYEVPAPLSEEPKPPVAATPEELAAVTGFYAANNSLLRLAANPDDSLSILIFTGNSWEPYLEGLQMRDNGLFSADFMPLLEFGTVRANSRTYIFLRDAYGNRHYQDDTLFLQKIEPAAPLSSAWGDRLTREWLLVNGHPDSLLPSNTEPRLSFIEPDGLEGLIAVSTHDGSFAVVDPSRSDELGAMMLFMPQAGRDLNDAVIVPRGGEEWVRFGSFVYRPRQSVPELFLPDETILIGDEGYAEWRSIESDGTAMTVTVTSGGAWKLFDPDMKCITTQAASGAASLPAAGGNYLLICYGSPGDTLEVAVAPAAAL
jgi:CubicO group peptidase (beta-lactamase class C family)